MILGTKLKPALRTFQPLPANIDTPKEFDSRTQWKDCIHDVRNQQKCGSCWAFAASEAFSDRVCIATNGQINAVYSPQNLVECDKTDIGCQGGQLDHVWNYIEDHGIVTDNC
jgi:cathepsin B